MVMALGPDRARIPLSLQTSQINTEDEGWPRVRQCSGPWKSRPEGCGEKSGGLHSCRPWALDTHLNYLPHFNSHRSSEKPEGCCKTRCEDSEALRSQTALLRTHSWWAFWQTEFQTDLTLSPLKAHVVSWEGRHYSSVPGHRLCVLAPLR